MKEYNHSKIEKHWQGEWSKKEIYKTLFSTEAKDKKPFYVLDMFPYPSGVGLHVGHPRGYIGSDVYARKKRMEGWNVLHPMGYDAFGLPAEQYALEHNINPEKAVKENVKTFRSQLDKIGFSFDWSREVNTTDPEYYKWTQWIFLKLYEKGLAYEKDSEVNWCPALGTVLANDEIIEDAKGNPVSERGNHPVEKKKMRQWFLKITEYADRLLEGLDKLDWPEHIKEIQRNWIGREEINGKVTYKMRDAVFARQRYWGEPIPIVHNADGSISTLSENELPLELPKVKSYEPTGTGEGPLAGVESWVKKGYETNTMPGWAASSWYYLRYMDPKNKNNLADEKEINYWKEVNVYVGGAEHATGHLLYARFWHKFLFDLGIVPTDEPFKELHNQGVILAEDGTKMGKRNPEKVVNPDDIVKTFGADTLRVYEMFMGPFDQSMAWNSNSIVGAYRFLERVWRLAARLDLAVGGDQILEKTIKKVTEDIEKFSFNTAISTMMICVNEMEKAENISKEDFKKFLQILAPFAPHITEELWHELGEKESIHLSSWPKYDESKVIEDEVVIGIQVNGKVRSEMKVSKDMTEEEAKKIAFADPVIAKWLSGEEPKKVIYVAGRILNIII